jgi:hypothetical protein
MPETPVNHTGTGYKVMGETCFGTPQQATLRGWLLGTSIADGFSKIGGVCERIGRFWASMRVASDIPITLHVEDAFGRTLTHADGTPLAVHTHSQADGRIQVPLHGLQLAPGSYRLVLQTPPRPAWALGYWGHTRTAEPNLTTVVWPVHIADPFMPAHITVLDLDETLYHNPNKSCMDVLKAALRKPEDMRCIPTVCGMARSYQRNGYVMLLSGSPETLRYDIERSSQEHGLSFKAGIVLKNFPAHAPHLREHVHYKLEQLAQRLIAAPQGSTLTLIGDNTESDPLIYHALQQFLEGSWTLEKIALFLSREHITQAHIEHICALLQQVRTQGIRVENIVIRCVPGVERPLFLNPVMSFVDGAS